MFPDWLQEYQQQGYVLLTEVFSAEAVETLRRQSQQAFAREEAAVRHRDGAVYAVRNLLSLWPEVIDEVSRSTLVEKILQALGPEAGLVRGLFFDKPPEQTWSLPWHKDLLIAVQEQTVAEGSGYSRPRLRMGVPHTEPPVEVLYSMLTARIHLDEMTPENGPLEVLPGSHRTGKQLEMAEFQPVSLHCRAGDVLLMSPLLVHASGKSWPGSQRHRRIVHLEYAGLRTLPGGVQWWEFYPIEKP